MGLFESLFHGEVTRRQRVQTQRQKAIADPVGMQDLLAKGMKLYVPEDKKVKTKKHPTKLAAVEAAIPKSDPRHGVGVATWDRYTKMLDSPRYSQFAPKDIMVAAGDMEFDKVREATHKQIQKQKTGTFSTFMGEEYAPMPGQEEWEAEHPPRIPHMRAEESFAWGVGTKAAIEAGKLAFRKGPAAKIGRRKAIALLTKAGPYGRLAAAGAASIVGMRAFEEVSSRTTEQVKKTEYGKEHPLAAELIGMGTGLVAGVAVPVEAMFGGMLTSRGAKSITKFQQLLKRKNVAGEAAMENPAAKEIIALKEAETAAAKASDVAVATVDKDKAATMRRFVGVLEGRVAKEKAAAMPMPGGTALAVREEAALARTQRAAGLPVPRAIARPGTVFEPTPRISGEPSKLKVPEKAIVIEQETPNLPMLKPDGSLSSLGSRKVVPYSYGNIKSEEGFDRVLSEVAEGKKAVDVVQKVGEMEEGIIRHSKVIPTKKGTITFKKKMSELGYDAEEVAGMNAKIAANIERFSAKKEPSALLDRALREPIPQKIESKIDLSDLSTEEKLYNFAKTRTPQQRLDLVEKGTITEAVNRRIVKEQKALIEGKPAYKEFAAKEAEADTAFLGAGTGSTPKDDGSYAMTKAEFVLKMMTDKAKGEAGVVSSKVLAGLTAGGTVAALAAPDRAEAMAFIGKLANVVKSPLLKAMSLTKSAEAIRQETGWFKGLDKKWRFEIDDSKAIVNMESKFREFDTMGYATTRLKNVLKHPTLFKAYPDLKNMPVDFEDIKGLKAGYAAKQDTIVINPNLVSSKTAKSNLLHEVQHAIQEREGFAIGGLSKEGGHKDYLRLAGEVEARDVAGRASLIVGARKEIVPYDKELQALDISVEDVLIQYSKASPMGTLAEKALGIAAASVATFGALSMPDKAEAGVMSSLAKVFKAATREEGKAAASKLNLEYNGVQEGLDGPLCHLFTDFKRGATFASKSVDEVDVKAALEANEELWRVANAGKNTAIGATVFAALNVSLSDIFSPSEAEAAGIKDLGRTISGLTATILEDVKAEKAKDLIKGMKEAGLISEAQVDGCYVLTQHRKSLVLIPNVKDVSMKKSMPPGAEAIVSPHVQFLYYTGVREGQELMNNAGVQWASCQGTAVWNSIQGHKTLMNILEDFIPNYNSSANRAIKAMAPVVDKFHVPMQERAFHLGMSRDLKRSYEKEFSKLAKRRKFKKGEVDEGLDTVVRLETLYKEHDAAYKASTAMKDEYQAAWKKAMIPFAGKSENSGTRIFLAAEDTASFENYPWLKDILTWEEKAAAAKIKDMMEHYSVRVIEAGEKVITTRPFMHHAWHPAMKSELARLNKGATLMSPPMTKLHSRSAGYMPMVPDAEYSVTSYLQDINIRLEAMEFWKKGEKDGWWAYKKWLTENPSQAPEGLIKAFNQFEKGFKPVDTSGGFNKLSEKVYAFEVARLLAFSASVPFKHALKLVADLRVFGKEGIKAAPKAASSIVKVAIKQRGGEEWLKKQGWGLDIMDEAVEAYTETGKLYRVVSDISPFRVNESMTDKAIGKFNEIGGTPTSIVERFDRALSTVAGINMAAKRGMTPAQATYAVFDTILKSNFLSGQLNPSWLRNPTIRLMMIFQGTPFKIMEQRIALHGRAWKGVGDTLKQLRKDVIQGEQDFKWEMIKQGFGKQKDIFGNTLLSQSLREMILVGTGITAAKYVWDGDLSHHFFHPPFFKAQRRDIAIGASPLVNASVETYAKYMDEDYDEFIVSTFFNSWFDSTYKGIPAPIPVNLKKAARLSENDIPERYRDSKLRYLFGVPAWDHD